MSEPNSFVSIRSKWGDSTRTIDNLRTVCNASPSCSAASDKEVKSAAEYWSFKGDKEGNGRPYDMIMKLKETHDHLKKTRSHFIDQVLW
jgi:hypothetical protein